MYLQAVPPMILPRVAIKLMLLMGVMAMTSSWV
jgi:hypothetical protein